MKKLTLIIFTLLVAQLSFSQPPAGKAKVGNMYGAKTDAKNSIVAAELPTLLKSKDTVAVKVKAKVLEVCSSKGCWLTFKVSDTESAFVKMKDYAFFVPTALIGKTVVLSGNAFIKTTSILEQRHYAEDAKKPQSEIDAITQPKSEIRFMADGIVVVE